MNQNTYQDYFICSNRPKRGGKCDDMARRLINEIQEKFPGIQLTKDCPELGSVSGPDCHVREQILQNVKSFMLLEILDPEQKKKAYKLAIIGEMEANRAIAAKWGLSPFDKGMESEYMIAWAEHLRVKMAAEMMDLKGEIADECKNANRDRAILRLNQMLKIKEPSWWIGSRRKNIRQIAFATTKIKNDE